MLLKWLAQNLAQVVVEHIVKLRRRKKAARSQCFNGDVGPKLPDCWVSTIKAIHMKSGPSFPVGCFCAHA